ncbi:hypothetical protein CLV72_104691 [Allonocardiopsis opalescens]|uniref:Uncharacterized protein n=1 Tax=Allonocardiopsis opalescens TaxID=1144618 RepID=A0A2T0Q5W9_9ACTN|nr:hypothetical protein CLV72_104691 [Allonocardiopsis opalescens]
MSRTEPEAGTDGARLSRQSGGGVVPGRSAAPRPA